MFDWLKKFFSSRRYRVGRSAEQRAAARLRADAARQIRVKKIVLRNNRLGARRYQQALEAHPLSPQKVDELIAAQKKVVYGSGGLERAEGNRKIAELLSPLEPSTAVQIQTDLANYVFHGKEVAELNAQLMDARRNRLKEINKRRQARGKPSL